MVIIISVHIYKQSKNLLPANSHLIIKGKWNHHFSIEQIKPSRPHMKPMEQTRPPTPIQNDPQNNNPTTPAGKAIEFTVYKLLLI